MSALNRRSILAGAAAVPVATAAIPAIAGAAFTPDAAIFELVKRLSGAWKHLEEVCTMREVAEDLMSQWDEQHPKPQAERVKYKITPATTVEEMTDWAKRDCEADADSRYKQAVAEWDRLHSEAEASSGYTAVDAAEGAVNDEINGLLDDLCDTPAQTRDGLVAKARCALRFANELTELPCSAIEDLILLLPNGATGRAV
jgi:hypothetical protein